MRRTYILLIALGVVGFLAVSALLARALSVRGAENAAITALVTAEAHGDATAAISLIAGCRADPACRARARSNAAALRRTGAVSIIQIQGSAGFSLGATRGTARVAWLAGGSLPRVQCLQVRHDGNVISGLRVELLRVSVRIASNADCPARF